MAAWKKSLWSKNRNPRPLQGQIAVRDLEHGKSCAIGNPQLNWNWKLRMAMEFAKTAAARSAAADDSWLPRGTRSFLIYCAEAGREKNCAFF
jgi:hypothetical protein